MNIKNSMSNQRIQENFSKILLAVVTAIGIVSISCTKGMDYAALKQALVVEMIHHKDDPMPTGNALAYFAAAIKHWVSLSSGGFGAVQGTLFGDQTKHLIQLNAVDVILIAGGVDKLDTGSGHATKRIIIDALKKVEDLEEENANLFLRAMEGYANKIFANIASHRSMKKPMCTEPLKTRSYVTAAEGEDGFKFVMDTLKQLVSQKKAAPFIARIIKAAAGGLSDRDWGLLAEELSRTAKYKYRSAECDRIFKGLYWWKFATHTESQLLALIGSELTPEPSIGIISFFQPCDSCSMLGIIDDPSVIGSFTFIKLDDLTFLKDTVGPTEWNAVKDKVILFSK